MGKPLRLLIVEDSENDALLLLRYLDKHGYHPVYKVVSTAEDAEKALTSNEWDIIISDYILPSFSGLNVLALLKDLNLDIPCIIISGKITDETAVAAMRAGARDYVMKDNLGRLGPAIERELAEAVVRREHKQAEAEVQEKSTALTRAHKQLKIYAKEIIRVQEAERKRIAIELHDDAAQNLALLTLEIDKILGNKDGISEETRTRLMTLRDDVNRTQQDVRRYSHELRPGVLDYLGLEAALEGLAQDISKKGSSLEVHVQVEGPGRRLPDELELAIFRIAQESLNNCWKHARANHAYINLSFHSDKIKLTVTDDGCGFDIKKDAKEAIRRRRLGLIGMRERAELVGGKLKIKSIIGQGSEISMEVKA